MQRLAHFERDFKYAGTPRSVTNPGAAAEASRVLRAAAGLVDVGKVRPLLNERRFTGADIAAAHALAEAGALGKVVVEL